MGEKLFRTWEIPRSGSKAKDGEKKRERERSKVGDNNGQATHGARKHAWRTQAACANSLFYYQTGEGEEVPPNQTISVFFFTKICIALK